MSFWTHIRGFVYVHPMGSSQAHKRYVLETVLNHLPIVSGSEGDMAVHIIQRSGYNMSSSCDEFGMRTDKGIDLYGTRTDKGWFETQSQYILFVDGDLRDRVFEETKREILKWLCRLSKRVLVSEVCINLYGFHQEITINKCNAFYEMFEEPSWLDENSTNWCEFMMWDRGFDTFVPLELAHKYYTDDETEKEYKRRSEWRCLA